MNPSQDPGRQDSSQQPSSGSNNETPQDLSQETSGVRQESIRIRDLAVREALSSLYEYPPEALQQIQERFEDNTEIEFSHSSLGVLPASLALDYASAMNNIVVNAKEHLTSRLPATQLLEELRELRDSSLAEYRHQSAQELGERNFHLGDFENFESALRFADEKVSATVTRLANCDPDGDSPELNIRSLDLAIMVLDAAIRNNEIIEKFKDRSELVEWQSLLMQRAHQLATEPDPTSPAQNQFEEQFLHFCDLKLEELGYIPPIHFVHDLDGNLVPDEDSVLKPGNIHGRLADVLDADHKIPGYQRLSLLDNLGRVHLMGKLANELFQHAGEHTHDLFEDALASINTAIANDIDTQIITANMAEYGKGLSKQFSDGKRIQITGKDLDSFAAEQKPYRLAEVFMNNPDGIFVMSDNSDASLANAVHAEKIWEGENTKITDLYFFASRIAGDHDTDDHRLAQALKEKDLPFGVNQRRENPKGAATGYQGTARLTELYLNWKQQRLQEGWPLGEMGAEAQKRVNQIVQDASAHVTRLKAQLDETVIQSWPGNLQSPVEFMPPEQVRTYLLSQYKRQLLADNRVTPILQRSETLLNEMLEQRGLSRSDDSSEVAVLAARAFRAARQERLNQRTALRKGHVLEGEVHLLDIGREKTAIVNGGNRSIEDAHRLLERRDVNFALDQEDLSYLLIRLTNGQDHSGKPIERTIAVCTKDATDSAFQKLADLEHPQLFNGRAVLLPRNDSASTHEAQQEYFQRHLHSYLTIAQAYYRNGFAPAGGVEKTLREHASVLADWGFNVRMIGGNAPDESNYDRDLLDRFEHRVIQGAHERDETALKIADALYSQKEVIPEYHRLYADLKEQIRDSLEGVDTVVLHNPLFLRNVPWTQAFIDLHREGSLNGTKIVGWVHDIGRFTEPERFPEEIKRNSPWWYANTRFPGISYVGVSPAVTAKLEQVDLLDSEDPVSSEIRTPVPPGSDYFSMIRQTRATEALVNTINWNETRAVWLSPGRIADRKNQIAAVEAVALLDDTTLIVTGKPKTTRNEKDGSEVIDDPYYELVEETVAQLGIQDRVVFLWKLIGQIGDREYEDTLAALSGFSDGIIVPAKEEGFGIDPRNAALHNPVVVSSDDEALKQNLGDAANFVPRGCHPLEMVLEMEGSLLATPNAELLRSARTVDTWEGGLKKQLGLFGTTEPESFMPGTGSSEDPTKKSES